MVQINQLLMCIAFAFLYNLFTVYITFDFMQRFIGSFGRNKKLVVVIFVFYELLLIVGSVYIYPLCKVIPMILYNIVLTFCLYHKPKKMQLYYVFFFSIVIGVMELGITYGSIYLADILGFINMNSLWQIWLLFLLNLFLIFIAYQVFITCAKKDSFNTKKEVNVLNFVLIPIFTILNIVLMIFVSAYMLEVWMYLLILSDIAFILFLNLYLFYLLNKLAENAKMKSKLALYDQASSLQYRYYQQMETKIEGSRKLVHDMKNHIHAVEGLYKTADKEAGQHYIDDLQKLISQFSQDYYTDNRVLNIIINDKVSLGKKHEVSVSCRLNMIDITFIREMDVTTIFANLLDNSIEAARCSVDPWVTLKADQVHDFIVVTVENSLAENLLISSKQSASDKKKHHGYGLDNVKRTLEKYNGYLSIESNEKTFKVSLFIPVENKEEKEI